MLYKCNTGILQFKYIKSNRWISVKLLIIINFIFNPVILIINIFKIKNLLNINIKFLDLSIDEEKTVWKHIDNFFNKYQDKTLVSCNPVNREIVLFL